MNGTPGGSDHRPSAVETVVGGVAAVDLAAGPYTARFLPGLGMVGTSLTFNGVEHVVFDPAGYRDGVPSGVPLLHPWANRLSRMTYQAHSGPAGSPGPWVDLDGEPPLHVHDGLAIHGTMIAAEGWQVEAVLADSTRAMLQARFVFGDQPSHLRSFPFPHDLVVFVELSDLGLRVSTEVRNTGERDVPLAFGWHPCLTLPGVTRADVAVDLPDREHVMLDGRGLPTGESVHEAARTIVLGAGDRAVSLDDCYRLAGARILAIAPARTVPGAPDHRVEIELDDRFGYAQVWVPGPGGRTDAGAAPPLVALEPMTAPVDALVSGDHRVVPPGERDTASFAIRVRPRATHPPT